MSYQRAKKVVRVRPGRAVRRVSRSRATRMGLLGMGDSVSPTSPQCDPTSDQYYQTVDPTGGTWGMMSTICNAQAAADTETTCAAQADQQLASLQATETDVQKNWSPTGYYDSKTIRSVVAAQQQVLQQGYSAISQALATNPPSDNVDLLKSNKDQLDSVAAQAANYIAAADNADAKSITAISAQGLKAWVLDTFDATYNATHAAYVVSCMEPWWYGAYQAISSATSAFASLVKAVAGLALKAGQAVLKAAEGTFDLLTFVTTYGPYIAAGILAWYFIGGPKAKPRTA